MFILTKLPNESDEVRAVSGLILKNNIRSLEQVPLPSVQYIKQCCLESIVDSSLPVRSTVGTIMTTVLQKIGVRHWPEVLPRLMELLNSTDVSAIEVIDIRFDLFPTGRESHIIHLVGCIQCIAENL